MNKIGLLLTHIFFLLLSLSCESREIYDSEEQVENSLQITAIVNELSQTRAHLDEAINEVYEKVIRFQWAIEDEIQLAFQQGDIQEISRSKIHTISEVNKSALFNVIIPEGINMNEPFTLYAYYGTGAIDAADPTTVILPQNLSKSVSDLETQANIISLWGFNEIKPVNGIVDDISLVFNHMGSIMSIDIYNSGYKTAVLSDIKLSSPENKAWIYSESLPAHFNMKSGLYEAGQEGSSAEMIIKTASITGGTRKTFYRWYVPGHFEEGITLELSAFNEGVLVGSGVRSITPKTDFIVGKNYRMSIDLNSEVTPYEMEIVDSSEQMSEITLFGTKLLNHPRILFTKAEEENIASKISQDPLLSDLVDLLRVKADVLLGQSIIPFPSGTVDRNNDILNISRGHLYRIIKLGMAYRIFNEKKYADKAIEHIINACSYPTWNPDHFLDVAEMAAAIAIGYDWLYPVLTRSQRSIIINALKTKAINPALSHYKSSGDSWFNSDNNWNTVCNAGISLAILAIAEDYADATTPEFVLNYAATNIPYNLNTFNPDGVAYEGPTYAQYTINYYSMLSKVLHDNFGNDKGLSDIKGVKSFGDFYYQTVSPNKRTFNFGDTSEGGVFASLSPFYFFYSKIFNRPHLATFYKDMLKDVLDGNMDFPSRTIFFLSIPWYDSRDMDAPPSSGPMTLFNSTINPIVVFNNSTSPNSIYLIAKGGKSMTAHQHLDMGSFVVENQGIRWLDDIGQENYALPGFGDYSPGGTRWNYFRNSSFSHNVPMIDGKIQYSAGSVGFEKQEMTVDTPYVVFNMSESYLNQATSAKRGFKHIDKDVILLQDEIQLEVAGQEVSESFITTALINLGNDLITLEKGDKKFYMKILEPTSFTKEKIDANTFRIHELERPVDGYYLFRITDKTVTSSQKIVFKILMSSDLNKINSIVVPAESIDMW